MVSVEVPCLRGCTDILKRMKMDVGKKKQFEAWSKSSGAKYTCSVLHLKERAVQLQIKI